MADDSSRGPTTARARRRAGPRSNVDARSGRGPARPQTDRRRRTPEKCESGGNPSSDDPSHGLDDRTRAFYHHALEILEEAGVPYAVGGAYALAHYAGIVRHTKDLDLFLRERDLPRAFKAFEAAGCRTELTHPHWIGKAYSRTAPASEPSKGAYAFVDLIYGVGERPDRRGRRVDGPRGPRQGRRAAGAAVRRGGHPLEQGVHPGAGPVRRRRTSRTSIQRGARLDWRRLLARFGDKRLVLLGHLAFFAFIYPSERHCVPAWVMDELIDPLRDGRAGPPATANGQPVCYGTFLSWEQYLPDIRERGFRDGRLQPTGSLTRGQVDRWTKAEK